MCYTPAYLCGMNGMNDLTDANWGKNHRRAGMIEMRESHEVVIHITE